MSSADDLWLIGAIPTKRLCYDMICHPRLSIRETATWRVIQIASFIYFHAQWCKMPKG